MQVIRLADAYRARRRDGGAGLALAETEVRATVVAALAGKPSPTR